MARSNPPPPSGEDPGAPKARATARLAVELMTSPTGSVDFDRFCERYGVSSRTIYRYVRILREDVFFGPEWPSVRSATVAGRKLIRFSEKPPKDGGTARELLSLYLAMTALKGLEGTVLREDLAGLW